MTLKTKNPLTLSDRLAEMLSAIFHPFVIVIPTMIIATMQGNTFGTAVFWTALSICVVILPLTYIIYSKVRSGQYSDPSVSIREQRHGLYAVAGVLLILLVAILVLGQAPRIFIAGALAGVLALAIAFVINRKFTKLSLHTIGISACTTILFLTTPQLGMILALFIPLVGWARIHLQHHTLLQIIIGLAVAVTSVLFIFHMFHLLSLNP
jgi:membrane-associated phospholipid phosphatase